LQSTTSDSRHSLVQSIIMKSFAALLLPALVASAAIEPRQGSIKFAGSTKLEPEINKKAIRVLQKFGPLDLKGRGSGTDSGQQNWISMLPSDAFCRSCTVLKGHIGLMNLDGTVAVPKNGSGVYIHHLLTSDMSKSQKPFVSSCSLGGGGLSIGGSKFIGSGEDNNNMPVWYTNKDGGHNGGFHIGAKDAFIMNADIVSLNPGASKIYITAELEYLPEITGSDTRETLLTVEACGGGRLNVGTTGPAKTKSGKYKFTENGQMILTKGHLHAGGDNMQVFVNDKVVCETKAVYDKGKGGGAISEMTPCPIIPVKAGDSMYFVATYDSSKHPVRHEAGGVMPDVMGMLDVVFAKA